ncbi:hypothetical protein K502DRAFT_363288 [Neoconidiobolus thromboides FSU 785]|nr:hypothetical protein K502DRAFT_363288 [Neoconidiobolus thromboides FSU 785]
METNELIFIVMGSLAGAFILVGIIAGSILRCRHRVLDKKYQAKVAPAYHYDQHDPESGNIPLNNVASTNDLLTKPKSIATLNQSSSDSFFSHGQGYDKSSNEGKGFLRNLDSVNSPSEKPRVDDFPPSYDSKSSELDPYGKGVVVLDGLLESKKWKLKDFKIDSSICSPPPSANTHRSSYQVW